MQSNLVYTEIKSSSTLYAGVTISSKARRLSFQHIIILSKKDYKLQNLSKRCLIHIL